MKERIFFCERTLQWIALCEPPVTVGGSYLVGRYFSYKEACEAVNAVVRERQALRYAKVG